MFSLLPPLLYAGVDNQIAQRPLHFGPRRCHEYAVAMSEVHCFEVIQEGVKNELNLSFETGSRSAKDWTPRRKIALSSALLYRAHVRSPHCAVRTFTADCRRSFVCSLIWTAR